MNYKLQKLLPLMDVFTSDEEVTTYAPREYQVVMVEYTNDSGVEYNSIIDYIIVKRGNHPVILSNNGSITVNEYGRIGVVFRVYDNPKVIE